MNELQVPQKLVVINDIAGYGRCAASMALPIISVLGVQACLVPTAVFSNHTGYPTWHFDDYTAQMPLYLDAWKKLSLTFDGIYVGFLGSDAQVEIIHIFLQEHPESLVIVDPVLGDHGKTYRTVTPAHCERIRELVMSADIITPNITEACLLTGTSFKESGWTQEELFSLCKKIRSLGPKKAVITGIMEDDCLINFYYEAEEAAADKLSTGVCRSPLAGSCWHGTGDIFASIIAADALRGISLPASVQKASDFIRRCIGASQKLQIPEKEGVCFENFLVDLVRLGHDDSGDNIGQQT